ncbi:hypothetical protein LCGC14_2138120 [marine sediment metagenome]|uniref:Uncharacterized protein n=1 Tax=marine sediment metagenome TaxID=412755 RepID=A0A0F9GVG4_9ZZZZ
MSGHSRNWDVCFEDRPAQMGAVEKVVWEAWLKKFVDYYERFGLNVPISPDPAHEKLLRVGSNGTLKHPEPYKIDAVGGSGEECEIIEVKDVGNMTAIGQLLTYVILFQDQYKGYAKMHLRLVCRRCPPAIEMSCRMYGINIDVMEEEVAEAVKPFRNQKVGESVAG